MIDKNWFDLEKCRIVDEYLEEGRQELNIKCKKRNFQLYINKHRNHFKDRENQIFINTDIFLSENDVHIASYRYDVPLSEKYNIPFKEIKILFQEWLLEEISLEELKLKIPVLEFLEVYSYYLQGKEGVNEYKLEQIRKRLNHQPTDEQTIATLKLFDIYKESKILKSLFPYTSVGRLCLSLGEDAGNDYDYCSFYCTKEKFWLSMNKDNSEYCFNSAEETIAFLEKKFQNL